VKVKSPFFEALQRWRRNDPEGFKRLVDGFEIEYRARLDEWVRGKPEDLAKLQGAALAYQNLSELFKHILTTS
jgi:hypothetical protein